MLYYNNYLQANRGLKLQSMKTQSIFDGTQLVHKLKLTNHSTLIEVLQSIFDDITIYNDEKIRALLKKSPKGFIPISQIIKLPVFVQFVERNPTLLINSEQIVKQVSQHSRKIICVNYQIRRVEPFQDKIKNKKMTPIFIDKLPNKSTEEICEFFKNIVGVVYQIYHKKIEKWAIILIDNYEVLEQHKDQIYMDNQKLTISNPLETLISYSDNQKLSSDFNILRLYDNKNMWDLSNDFQDQKIRGDNRHHNLKMDQRYEQQMQQFQQNENNFLRHLNSKNGYTKQFNKQYREQELDHRIKLMQTKRNIKNQIDMILNFDNTALFELCDNDNYMAE